LISLLRRLFALAHRFPWLLPALSFAAGWLGFVLASNEPSRRNIRSRHGQQNTNAGIIKKR